LVEKGFSIFLLGFGEWENRDLENRETRLGEWRIRE
jgi:hypothetical protein